MKIALYIEDGLEQIVLTPEGETEKGILGKLHDGTRELSIRRGEFYECRGGWVRHSTSETSTMIVLRVIIQGTATAIGEATTAADDAAPSVADLGDRE